MTSDQHEIQRKLRILWHAEKIGDVSKTCRYFGIGRASFYRWRKAYLERGEAGLINAKTIPKNPANHVRRYYASFSYQAGSWDRKRRGAARGYAGQGYRLAHIPTGSTATPRYDKQVLGGMIRHRNTP